MSAMSDHDTPLDQASQVISSARAAEHAIQHLCRTTVSRPTMTPAEVDVVLAHLARCCRRATLGRPAARRHPRAGHGGRSSRHRGHPGRLTDVHETGSTQFSGWGGVFGDQAVAAAMIDRIVHHADVLTLKGASYRLRGRGIDSLPSIRTTTGQTES